jgi:hypothetical protein
MQIVAPKLPEAGIHKARIIAIEDLGIEPDPNKPGKTRHRLKLIFEFEDGSTQWKWVTATLGYRSTFRPIVEALLGGIPEVLEISDLIGRDCEIRIERYVSKDVPRSRVTEVRPLTQLSA